MSKSDLRPSPPVAMQGVRLLDVDPELGAGLTGQELEDARAHAVLPTLALDPGSWSIDQLRAPERIRGEVHGFILLDGALTIRATLAGRRCVRLLMRRELVLLDGLEHSSLPIDWGWSALTRTQLAVLDDRLLAIGTHWPRLLSAILRRAAGQTQQALLQQTISQLPRVEERLLALFWTIADRQGVVRPDGVHLGLPMTHQTLAEMIGAQRPTVSLGLSRLAESGLVRSAPDGWLLDPTSARSFEPPEPELRVAGG